MENQNATRREVLSFLDNTIPELIRLEDEIGIMDFIEDCMNEYYSPKKYDLGYESARDRFLNDRFGK